MSKLYDKIYKMFEGINIDIYDLDDSLYIEDIDNNCSYLYNKNNGKLIKHND